MATGTRTTQLEVTNEKIRRFMRDYASNNVLLDGVEFNTDDLNDAVEFTVAKYNAFTPVTSLTANSINSYVMLIGVAAHLLRTESFKQLRNAMTFRDGDINPIGIDDKAMLYTQLSERLSAEFDTRAQAIKLQNNLEGMLDSMGSGYSEIFW